MSSSLSNIMAVSKISLRRRFLATHSSALAALLGKERFLWNHSLISYQAKSPMNPSQMDPLKQQLRWLSKHQAKMGQHLEKLDEMAHEKTRQEAEERRHKKKAKKAQKKAKKKGGSAVQQSHDTTSLEDLMHSGEEDFDEELHHEDEEEEDEDVLPDPVKVKSRMMKIVDTFEQSLRSIRGAEPTPEIFDDVVVDAYGSNTPLKSVAQVVIASQTQALATCYDPALAKTVSLAIRDKLSLNPSVEEGGVVKIPLPRVSMESRQKTATLLNKRAENYRQRIRRVRRNVMEIVKKGVHGKLEGISKDDAFRVQKEIESTTDSVVQSLNQIAEKKHDSIMAV